MLVLSSILYLGFATSLFSQYAISSAATELKGSGGVASVSIGQVSYVNAKTPFDNVNFGVQQVTKSNISSVRSTVDQQISIQMFPNPAQTQITIQTTNLTNDKLTYRIFDSKGNQVGFGNILEVFNTIDISTFANGIYSIIIGGNNEKYQCKFSVLH
jgi:hypothetical protein